MSIVRQRACKGWTSVDLDLDLDLDLEWTWVDLDVWTKWERIKGQLGIRSIPATAGSAMILLPIATKSGVKEN